MRVAIIEPVGGHGGMWPYDAGLLQGLVANGIEATLYTCDRTEVSPPMLLERVKTSFRGIYGDAAAPIRAMRFVVGLFRSLRHERRNGSKVTHFHFFHTSPLELLCVMAARIMGFKVVVTAHDVESFAGGKGRVLGPLIYRLVDRVIAHNQISRDELIKKMRVVPEKISIIPHGNYLHVLEPPCEKKLAREKLGLPNDSPIILFFGQIKKVKGLDILLRAMPHVVSNIPGVRLVVAGKVWKDDWAVYQSLIEKHGLGEHLVLDTRYIPDETAWLYYSAADIVVLPYRRIYQSGVLLMAMSMRKPVLVSDIPGMVELVQDGGNGIVFRSADDKHLADRLSHALSHDEELAHIAEQGFNLVQRRHDWRRVGELTVKAYRSAI